MSARRKVEIRAPGPNDEARFLAAVARSRRLHRNRVSPSTTPKAFRAWLERATTDRHVQRLVIDRESGDFAGVVNLNEVVRGAFQSAYLGYYVFVPFARRGFMDAGLRAVVREAFGPLRLHRLEANILPENAPSIALVERLGFRREGYSPRYLKVGGRWRDHERWALLREDGLAPGPVGRSVKST